MVTAGPDLLVHVRRPAPPRPVRSPVSDAHGMKLIRRRSSLKRDRRDGACETGRSSTSNSSSQSRARPRHRHRRAPQTVTERRAPRTPVPCAHFCARRRRTVCAGRLGPRPRSTHRFGGHRSRGRGSAARGTVRPAGFAGEAPHGAPGVGGRMKAGMDDPRLISRAV